MLVQLYVNEEFDNMYENAYGLLRLAYKLLAQVVATCKLYRRSVKKIIEKYENPGGRWVGELGFLSSASKWGGGQTCGKFDGSIWDTIASQAQERERREENLDESYIEWIRFGETKVLKISYHLNRSVFALE